VDAQARGKGRRRLTGLVAVLVAGALAIGACSDDGGNEAGGRPGADDEAAVSTTMPAASDSTAICTIFNDLAEGGAGRGAQFEASTPEGWEQRIATTGEIVDAAPAEWRDEAVTYLQMVKDRAQLAAENGYVGVNDLAADVRDAFISSHRAMQAEVNELIAYMRVECLPSASG
jgi:hypothetical protein